MPAALVPILSSQVFWGGAAAAAGTITGGVLASKGQSSAAKSQADISTQALDYEKEQDAYSRQIDAERYAKEQIRKDAAEALEREIVAKNQANLEARRGLETQRYGDYTGRIAPYLSTGASANERMARLLGLGPTAPAA